MNAVSAPEVWRVPRALSSAVLALIVLLFAVRNLPWHLDDYDQAKQAFVSFEMVERGAWDFQHTPAGRIATKPPLAGWISAALYGVLRPLGPASWELAWRLPPFAAALILVALLWRSGRALGGRLGALLAVSAFAFNLTTPRLATLVRTDMMLTLFIFFAGWLILEKVRTRTPWTPHEQFWLGLTILGSMLTKGPILYAFLLPGLAAFAWLMRRKSPRVQAWSGSLPWLLPLLGFALWAGLGIWLSRDFYQQVVVREFLGRFDVGEHPVHKHQPVWFYGPHLLRMALPWSLALLALLASPRLRAALRREPELLWLACWAAGALLSMSLVPSKRPDRIFPVVPPLCLLFSALAVRALAGVEPKRARLYAGGGTALAICISGGYTLASVREDFQNDQRALVHFGAKVRALTASAPERLAIGNALDEGLLPYTGQTRFSTSEDQLARWQRGELDWVVLRERDLQKRAAEFAPFVRALEQPRVKEKNDGPYVLIHRAVPGI